MRRLLTTIAAILLLHSLGRTQQFPVQVTPQLLPPYSVQLSDYYSPGAAGSKLNLLLLLRDFNKPQLQVRLRMSIEGQSVAVRTREDVTFTPFTIESGIPKYVDPSELSQYFAPNNLQFSGITQQQYEQTGKLPEGFYTFCFEIIEVGTNQVVSNKGCSYAWMTLNEPPILNLPRKAEGVIPIDPQNLIFQWTPRHTASPTAAFTTDYIFTIVELNDNAIAPEVAFLSNPPLYVDSVQTTTYLYDATKPALIAGKKYAWRVQAKAKNGVQDLATFRNNGYSETFWFTYQNNCAIPVGATASAQGQRVGIEWTANPVHLEYKVEYRETNNADAEWFEIGNTIPRVSISDLKPNKIYEYRVGGACEYGRFTFGNILQFTTNGETATTVPECGTDPNLTAPQGTLLQALAAGDTIHAGDYDVVVSQVTGQGSFSGEGFVKMSWLGNASIAVRFTNIGVNTDKKLVNGVIETAYDPSAGGIADVDAIIGNFTGGYDVGRVITGVDTADHVVSYEIQWPGGITTTPGAGYDPQTGQGPVTINLTPVGGGAVQTIVVNELPTTIKDSEGNIYQVNKDGTATSLGKSGGEQLVNTTNRTHVDTDKAIILFKNYPEKQIYAFDEWKATYKKSSAFNNKYERLNNDYYVSAKAIAPGKTDYLKAVVRLTDNTLTPDSIQFVNGKGTIYTKTQLNDSTFEISVVGGPESDAQEIYALYPRAGSKTFNLGKVLVASYLRKDLSLVLVPVNGASINQQVVSQKLNEVYNKLNIYWEVKLDENFQDNSWDETNNGLDVTGSGSFSVLTSEMKALNKAYSSTHYIDPKTSYIFVLNNANEQNVAGDMPRGKQFGYIFTSGNTNPSLTAAHEIAHGLFKLRHTFDGYGLLDTDLTDNLMNYANGETLAKLQWDLLHDPGITIGLFDKDEDVESLVINNIGSKFLNPDKESYTFYGANGTFITLPSHTFNHVFFYGLSSAEWHKLPTGALTGFSAKINGRTRHYKLQWSGNEIDGFIETATGERTPDSLYKSVYSDSVVLGVAYSNYYAVIKVRASGLQNFNTVSSKTFLLETLMTFNPFTSPISLSNKTSYSYESNPQIINGGAFSVNENDIKLIAPHEEKAEMLIVEKIIQLKSLYPELFKLYSKYFDDWNNALFTNNEFINILSTLTIGVGSDLVIWDQKVKSDAALKNLWTSNPKEYYTQFLNGWILFIQNFDRTKTSIINNLSINTSPDILMAMLELCTDNDLKSIIAEKRMLAISILASNKAVFDQRYERQIVRLINFTPQDQCDYVSDKLKGSNEKTNNPLLEELIYVNDDSFLGFGDDNYKELIKAISKVVAKSATFKQQLEKITLDNFMDHYVDFSYKTIWRRLWNNGVGTPYVKSEASLDHTTNKVTVTNEFVYKGMTLYSKSTPYDVFAPVWLANNQTLSMINDISSESTGDMVPAIVLKYVDDKGDLKTAGDIINATIDGVSIASGYGAIVNGVKGLRKALVIADMIGSGISLTDNLGGGGFINERVLAFSNALTAVVGIAQFGKWGSNPITPATNIKDVYYVTKNVVEELPDVVKAEDLCKTVNKLTNTDLISIKTNNPIDLAVAKKTIERIKIEAEVAGKTNLLNEAEKALQKLNEVRFLNIDEGLLQSAKNLIGEAISIESQFAKDQKTIEAVALFLDPVNNNALQALGGETALKSIITKNNDMPCLTCLGTDGKALGHTIFAGRPMAQMIGDLMDFCKRFSSKPEFIDLIKGNNGLNSANAAVREGTQHVLNSIRQNPEVFNSQTISRMDMVFEELPSQTLPCINCRFDLEMISPPAQVKFYEFKSYKAESIIGISVNQFKNYLSQVTSWDEFRYIFNRAKTSDLDAVKKEFQKVFANNAQQLWEANESLMKLFKKPNGIPVQNFAEFSALTKHESFWSQLTFIDF
jgi:TANFOR domain-containing protein